jgi:hypothetical protein
MKIRGFGERSEMGLYLLQLTILLQLGTIYNSAIVNGGVLLIDDGAQE